MVFTNSAETTQPEVAEQTQTETPPQDSFLNKLVETKGENWKDPEVLAKGKLEADQYISQLETQLKEAREDLTKQDYARELLSQLQNKAADPITANPVMSNNIDGTDTQDTTGAISEDNLKSLVEQTLTQRERENTVQQNLLQVDKELESSFGTEATATVQKKAQELGMSMERLRDIAAESPNAFFTLIGEPQKTFSPMVQGTVRTEGVNMQPSTERNWAYYQNLRRENRNLYYSPKIQQQMFADQSRLGDKFGI